MCFVFAFCFRWKDEIKIYFAASFWSLLRNSFFRSCIRDNIYLKYILKNLSIRVIEALVIRVGAYAVRHGWCTHLHMHHLEKLFAGETISLISFDDLGEKLVYLLSIQGVWGQLHLKIWGRFWFIFNNTKIFYIYIV